MSEAPSRPPRQALGRPLARPRRPRGQRPLGRAPGHRRRRPAVVVKSYADGSRTSWARERVGLAVAGPLGLAPRLLGGRRPTRTLVVMEDLGTAPSVADHLLGSDPAAPTRRWSPGRPTLGRLHAAHPRRPVPRAARPSPTADGGRGGRGAHRPVPRRRDGSLDEATADWAAQRRGARARPEPPDVRALACAARRRRATTRSARPTSAPTTTCCIGDGCRLIDFEWSEVRHPAWDAAYLTVPWPTCWCSWRIPRRSPPGRSTPTGTRGAEGIAVRRAPTPFAGRRRAAPGCAGRWSRCRGRWRTRCARTSTPATRGAPSPGRACSTASAWSRIRHRPRPAFAGEVARAHPAAVGRSRAARSPRRTAEARSRLAACPSTTSSPARATSPTVWRRPRRGGCSGRSAWATTTSPSRRSASRRRGTRSRPATCRSTGWPRPSRTACTPRAATRSSSAPSRSPTASPWATRACTSRWSPAR